MNDYLQRAIHTPRKTGLELGQDPACYRAAGSPSISSGHHLITPIRRKTVITPAPRKSSYSLAFSRDYGENLKRKSLIKQLLNPQIRSDHSFAESLSRSKLESKVKRLTAICDLLSDGCVPSKVSKNGALPLDLGVLRHSVTPQGHYSRKVSQGNVEWLQQHAQQTLFQSIVSGEVVPSLQQLSLYGRRPVISRFRQRKLWQNFSPK